MAARLAGGLGAALGGPVDNGERTAAAFLSRRLAALPWLLPVLWRVLRRAPSADFGRWLSGEPGALERLTGRELHLAMVLTLDGAPGRGRDGAALAQRVTAAAAWLAALAPSDLTAVEELLAVLDGHGWAPPALVSCERWDRMLAALATYPAE